MTCRDDLMKWAAEIAKREPGPFSVVLSGVHADGSRVWTLPASSLRDRPAMSDHDLLELLKRAADWQPLPVVPRKPKRTSEHLLTVTKESRSWYVRENATGACSRSYRTKREATEAMHRWVASRNETVDRWEAEWAAIVAAGEHGVDFRWADR